MGELFALIVSILIIGFVGSAVIAKFAHPFIVNAWETGLLYHNGIFKESLPPGKHVRYGLNYKVTNVDLRAQSILITGQDLLTSDFVPVKLSLLINQQVTDAVAATIKL